MNENWTRQAKQMDLTLRALVEKKKELLLELLRYSIQSVLAESTVVPHLRSRQDILSDLEITEKNLKLREERCGLSALVQEKDMIREIRSVLEAIQDNNAQLIEKMEHNRKSIEVERLSLEKVNKLSGYINQGQGYRSNKGAFSGGYLQKKQSIISGTL